MLVQGSTVVMALLGNDGARAVAGICGFAAVLISIGQVNLSLVVRTCDLVVLSSGKLSGCLGTRLPASHHYYSFRFGSLSLDMPGKFLEAPLVCQLSDRCGYMASDLGNGLACYTTDLGTVCLTSCLPSRRL